MVDLIDEDAFTRSGFPIEKYHFQRFGDTLLEFVVEEDRCIEPDILAYFDPVYENLLQLFEFTHRICVKLLSDNLLMVW
jgi:hypothetical protein